MVSAARKELLCTQNALTGIDFLWVNPDNHKELVIFFVVDITNLSRPVITAPSDITVSSIVGDEDGSLIATLEPSWVTRLDPNGTARSTLTVFTEEEGDFQHYTLNLVDNPDDGGLSRLDPFCSSVEFSFKQACPTVFDCRIVPSCDEPERDDYPVDYVARDFDSFRQALLAYSSDRYPEWDAQVPADFGGMVSELLSALGDEFSYIQDRYLRESNLESLTQRRSFSQLSRLIDYELNPGQAASGYVVLKFYSELVRPPAFGSPALENVVAGAALWADQDDRAPVPFEVGSSAQDMFNDESSYAVQSHWTDLPVYVPDNEVQCLEAGSRTLYVADSGMLSAPFPADVLVSNVGQYWVGKKVLIETRPSDPKEESVRFIVTLDEPVSSFDDPISGVNDIVRLHWQESDALSHEVNLGEPIAHVSQQVFVSANLVPVRSGRTVSSEFVIGNNAASGSLSDPLQSTIERAGPLSNGQRAAIHRHTLEQTVNEGLSWERFVGPAGYVHYYPDVHLTQIDPASPGDPPQAIWTVGTAGLSAGDTDEYAVVEAGQWGVIAHFERKGEVFDHRDYLSDKGYTLRFGAPPVSQQPTAGDVFKVHYRTGPGASANVPEDTITRGIAFPHEAVPLKVLPAAIKYLRNPLAISDGGNPQSLELAKRIAPAAYKEQNFRAVRNEDYREHAERLDWVQQAGAVTRWTGAWGTTFVSADPEGAFSIDETRYAELAARLNAVRQVGRCVIPKQPVYLALDLKIAICVNQGFAFGDVSERVIIALSPNKSGYFHPDKFTFGVALNRPSLEAAIACVAGVEAVLEIQYRVRGHTEFVVFDTPSLPISDNRIYKLENNPNRPGQGSLRVYKHKIRESVGA